MSETGRHKELAPEEREQLITLLRARFMKHPERHKGIEWERIQDRLEADPLKLGSLFEMERTGGEPDVVGHDKVSGQFIFYDCAAETPKDRRNLCYDNEALDARKEFKPASSATEMAVAMGIGLLTEEEYGYLQTLGDFDTKTSSWLKTPPEIRKHGGAIFGDRRFGRVFVYHNGASSYYAVRGFRGSLKV